MSGNRLGGKRAAATNKSKFGHDFYATIGRKGGRAKTTGGFASNRELAKKAGAKGGHRSKRGGASVEKQKIMKFEHVICRLYLEDKMSIPAIAEKLGISYWSLRKWANQNLEGYNREYGDGKNGN